MSKKILFDGRFLSLSHAGLGRYSGELLKSLLKLDKRQKYILVVVPMTRFDKELTRALNERDEPVEIIEIPARHYSWAEQTSYLSFLNKVKPDLVHFPHFNHPIFYKGDFVVTIHDLTLSDYNERGGILKRFAYSKMIASATQRSKKILTVSDYVKKQLTKEFSLPSGKVVTTHNGIDPKFTKITNPSTLSRVDRYGLKDPYVVSVGQWRSHKNLLRLLEAFKKVIQKTPEYPNLKLAFVGRKEKKYPQLEEKVADLGLDQRVVFTGFVKDEDLPVIYNNAILFVFASLSEGFGLPGLEAQACEVPVVSSNKTALPEIYGEGALYFDPENVMDMAEKIAGVVNNKKLQEKLKKLGVKNSQKYSWDETAKKTLAVYREILYK
jgi:glycosyltransferase involved in cell wall biosynthesis